MQTLESMRRRITSAEDLQAVVRMMKAMAAVSIRQYERAVESLVEYTHTIEMGLQIAMRQRGEEVTEEEPLTSQRSGVIVFGSDQGMCGSFNEQVASFALHYLAEHSNSQAECDLMVVGSRLIGRFEDSGLKIRRQFGVPNSVPGITPVVQDLLLQVEELRFRHQVERAVMIHHRPSVGPQCVQLLPVDAAWLRALADRPWPGPTQPQYRLPWRELFSALIRQHLSGILYRAFAESLACENASRLASMQSAERNIEDHLDELTRSYHLCRQQTITEELLDIVAGFETLTSMDKPNGKQ